MEHQISWSDFNPSVNFSIYQKVLGLCLFAVTLSLAGCSTDQVPAADSSGSSLPATTNASANPGASPANTPAKSAATITAQPNPVPPGEGFGTSTITWNTGDGTPGEIYVALDGQPEKRVAGERTQGSLEAPWIGVGSTYEFRLYAGKEQKKLLASVKVVRAEK